MSESDLPGRRRSSRLQEIAENHKKLPQLRVMLADLALQQFDFPCYDLICGQHLAQAYKRPHYLYAGANRYWTAQHIGEHDRSAPGSFDLVFATLIGASTEATF